MKPLSVKRIKNVTILIMVMGFLLLIYQNLQEDSIDKNLSRIATAYQNLPSSATGASIGAGASTSNGTNYILNTAAKSAKGTTHTHSWTTSFFEMFRLVWSSKPPTQPFSKTSAAATTEINLLLNHFDSLPVQNQILIINEILDDVSDEKYAFFKQIFENLHQNRPKTKKLDRYKSNNKVSITRYEYNLMDNMEKDKQQRKNSDFAMFTERHLSSFLELTPEELELMTESHTNVVKNLPEVDASKYYKGNGIVYVGGGKFNFLTLLSVKAVRDLGSKTPIEILIPSLEEFDANLCFKIYPKYNAKCLLMPKVLRMNEPVKAGAKTGPKTGPKDNVFKKIEIKGYQYKVLALLLSSFENVLFLDSDNIPTKNPDQLFSTNPFKKYGMIIWPDYWKRSTSPSYYNIASIPINKNEYLPKYNENTNDYEKVDYSDRPKYKIPFHQFKGALPDPSSESGQLMINKNTHLRPLILSLYYNLYGPSHYYPLFSQGSAGEGDKETFIAACCALGVDFYQVRRFLTAMGHFNSENQFVGTAMAQYNPINDYQKHLPEEIFFVHANFPKLNPWDLKNDGKLVDDKTGQRHRLYGNAIKQKLKCDFELLQWKNMKYFVCQLRLDLVNFKLVDHKALCGEIDTQLRFLENTTHIMEDPF